MENKISIILPLHKLDEQYLILLNNALLSAEDHSDEVKVLIVAPTAVAEELSNVSNKLDVKVIENKTDDHSFQNQVNIGVENCDTEWFSILEVDDTYNDVWFKSARQYIGHYGKDYGAFLPVVKDTNSEGNLIAITNEAVWAYGFSETIGELQEKTLLEYQNFQTSGGIYKTEDVKKVGIMFKENIRLTFGYEFLLRFLHNGFKIMVIPKVGYNHVNFREDSLYWHYKHDEGGIGQEESYFWLNAAKEEYLHNDKREVRYEPADAT